MQNQLFKEKYLIDADTFFRTCPESVIQSFYKAYNINIYSEYSTWRAEEKEVQKKGLLKCNEIMQLRGIIAQRFDIAEHDAEMKRRIDLKKLVSKKR